MCTSHRLTQRALIKDTKKIDIKGLIFIFQNVSHDVKSSLLVTLYALSRWAAKVTASADATMLLFASFNRDNLPPRKCIRQLEIFYRKVLDQCLWYDFIIRTGHFVNAFGRGGVPWGEVRAIKLSILTATICFSFSLHALSTCLHSSLQQDKQKNWK